MKKLKEKIAIPFTVDDWIEIESAMDSKADQIKNGDFGEEDKPGEDKRWVADLHAIAATIRSHLYGEDRKRGKNHD